MNKKEVLKIPEYNTKTGKKVNLTELETFGFRKVTEADGWHYDRNHKYIYQKTNNMSTPIYELYISTYNMLRFTNDRGCIIAGSMQVMIFDLIQAGLLIKE